MEPVLKPLVYREPLALVERHRERGEPVYIVSATLQEIVEELADELGFDGALGSTCEVEDGVYTGRSLRACHGEGKAAAVRELAGRARLDLAASTAYSDSHTDLPFLEAVGNPVAVNPDRELRRIAAERGWPVLTFSGARLSGGGARLAPPWSGSRSCSAPAPPSGPPDAVRPEERIAALGFSEADTADALRPLRRRRDAREARARALADRLARDAARPAARRATRGGSRRSRATSAGTAAARSAT